MSQSEIARLWGVSKQAIQSMEQRAIAKIALALDCTPIEIRAALAVLSILPVRA